MEKPPPRKTSNTIIMTPRLNLQGILPKLESISMLPSAGCSVACESLLNPPGGSLEVTVRDVGRSENTSGDKQENSLGNLFLDPGLSHRFEDIRLQYADILYRWGMYLKCAEVMKYCLTGEEEMIGIISEISWCSNCGEMLRHTQKCGKCKMPPICCAICEGPCYGAMVTCVMCSHGGHLSHMEKWFVSHSSCPLGCGCECKL
ncbi:GATOR complex protein WDR59 [Ditylenchus destructor]|uniref:GATOR complex protein WDR59 n=1 Tax=Ditylenchus destructor TaxID=166010 RepID=A0AAD4N9I0_9BILA|nr:GATOR complex protein WDR59 [Ditylenchus destructor]